MLCWFITQVKHVSGTWDCWLPCLVHTIHTDSEPVGKDKRKLQFHGTKVKLSQRRSRCEKLGKCCVFRVAYHVTWSWSHKELTARRQVKPLLCESPSKDLETGEKPLILVMKCPRRPNTSINASCVFTFRTATNTLDWQVRLANRSHTTRLPAVCLLDSIWIVYLLQVLGVSVRYDYLQCFSKIYLVISSFFWKRLFGWSVLGVVLSSCVLCGVRRFTSFSIVWFRCFLAVELCYIIT